MASSKLVLCFWHVLVVVCITEAQQQCSFDTDEGRILACGTGTSSQCMKIQRIEEYKTIVISPRIADFHSSSSYDVHAFRLCDGQGHRNVTLADALNGGEQCQVMGGGAFRTISFQGCNGYFEDGSNKNLTIYAYVDVDGCNGGLLYRFLLINGTGTQFCSDTAFIEWSVCKHWVSSEKGRRGGEEGEEA